MAKLEKTGTPGIYRRGGRYVVVYRDPLGRQRKQAARTLAEARAVKASIGADIVRGEFQQLSRSRFDEYAAEWARSYKGRTSRGFREQTRIDYARLLGIDPATWQPLKPACGAVAFFGRARLVDIGPRDVKRYVAALEQRGLEPSSVRKTLAPLRALFATAVEEQLIRLNPATGVRVTRPVEVDIDGEEQPTVKTLSDAELLALLEQTPEPWRLFFEFLAHTGLRIGEAVALQWRHVDFGRRRLLVRRRWYRGSFAPPKSKYGRRDVPLSDGMTHALWELRKASAAAGDDELVFTTARGRMIASSNLMSRVLKPAGRASGVGDWIGFHTFRHSCATNLFRHGLNAKQVQAWMGHHSPAFTLATYVHLLPEDLPERPAFLDALTERGNAVATRQAETTRETAGNESARIPRFAAEPSDDARAPEAAAAYS